MYWFKPSIILLIVSFLISSCSQSNTNKSSNSPQIFRYNQPSSLHSLDPAFAKDQASIWVTKQLFNTLVEVDENLNIKPSVAKSWEFSNDNKQITFHLRNDVLFHEFEGKKHKLTAMDVVYSFNRIIDKEVASPGAWIFNGHVADENPFVALNDSTFQLNLNNAFQPILGILSMQYCSIVSKNAAQKLGKSFRSQAIGSGAFQLKAWNEGESLFLEKNNKYWETDKLGNPLPYLSGIKVTFNENKRSAFMDFMNGQLDFISGLDASYKDELLTELGDLKPEHKGKIIMEKTPYLNTEYLGFNLKNPNNKVLLNEKVRLAINYGFDRVKMIRYLRNNIGKPAVNGFIPPGLPGYNPNLKGFDYQPDKSIKLLKEAGYNDKNLLPEIVLETTNSYNDLSVFIQRQLLEIGIRVRIELTPPSFLREKTSKGESDFFRASWIADYPDAETFLTVFYGDNPAPPNYTRFKNNIYDNLYKKSLSEQNNKKRYDFYMSMDSIAINNAAIVPLFYDEVVRFTKPNIKGLKVNAFNLLDLKTVKTSEN